MHLGMRAALAASSLLVAGLVTSTLTGCGSSESSSTTTPSGTPAAAPTTVGCNVNLQFGDSVHGHDVAMRSVTIMASGADLQWSLDAMAGATLVRLGWSRQSVSLSAPGAFAGGSVQNPPGLSVSADGSTTTFRNIVISAPVGGTASVSGTVSCPTT